nr:cell division protein FtsQ [uncultured Mediterraneibacter sp.]
MKTKKNKKRKIWPVVLSVFGVLAAAALIAVFLFRTKAIEVEGNTYYSDNTITTWIEKDDLSVNTLYLLAKYHLSDPELPAGVERLSVSLKSPWTLRVQVEEKEMAGYVSFDDAYLYFDGEGTAILRSKKVIEGVPCIEGLAFDTAKVAIGKTLPVEDESIFENIVDVSRGLKKHSLTPDRLSCAESEIRIYFGSVEVMLGDGGYEEKLQQVEPILAKLSELYPDTAGTLHLENYTSDSESIRFVPAG